MCECVRCSESFVHTVNVCVCAMHNRPLTCQWCICKYADYLHICTGSLLYSRFSSSFRSHYYFGIIFNSSTKLFYTIVCGLVIESLISTLLNIAQNDCCMLVHVFRLLSRSFVFYPLPKLSLGFLDPYRWPHMRP